MTNLANIKLEVLQSTFLKWSRELHQNVSILKKRLHNFYPNLILTININEFLFYGPLLVERSNLANIKLELLQSTFLK